MSSALPAIRHEAGVIRLSGEWTLAAMLPVLDALRTELAANGDQAWDLGEVTRLDSAAAALIWERWGERWPTRLTVAPSTRHILERAASLKLEPPAPPPPMPSLVLMVGRMSWWLVRNLIGVVELFGQLLVDWLYLFRHPREFPLKELSANVYRAGAQALPVAALVGFLIGITISYLSALQLKSYGADLFIVNILGISIIRELGPVLVAVLVAGRSGSAITAQIGVMRVTEEIDALSVMGISSSQRIVLPKVLALTFAMPLLVLWTSGVALVGGMLAANVQLDLSIPYFITSLPRAVPVANLVIGLGKGVVFGFMIALIACHFGLHVKPNTESLSTNTTTSVVSSITIVVIIDAIFAILTKNVGVPSL